MKNNINICHIADVHYGQHRLKPEKIYEDFHKFVYPYLNSDLDILCIGGDFFHILLDMNSKYGFYVNLLIQELTELAFKHDFYIRVIRGTFLHDRNQPHMFLTIPRYETIKKDTERIKYINTLALEYIDKFDMWFLYKPDDINLKNIYSKIKRLLKENSVDKVDIFLNHGYFKHMLPEVIKNKEPALDYDIIKKYIKGAVLNGHVHQPSIYEKVISSGSFERFAFGEEEDKGFFYITYNKSKSSINYKFIKNENALIFKTVDLTNCDSDDKVIDSFKSFVSQYQNTEEKVFIMVVINNTSLKHIFNKICENMNIEIHVTKNKHEILETEEINVKELDLPLLTADNIFEYMKNYIVENFNIKISESEMKKMIA